MKVEPLKMRRGQLKYKLNKENDYIIPQESMKLNKRNKTFLRLPGFILYKYDKRLYIFCPK